MNSTSSKFAVTVGGQPQGINVFLVDARTGAFPGVSIRPTEDALAVTQTFEVGGVTDEQEGDTLDLLIAYLDHALNASRTLDRTFWLLCAVDLIDLQPPDDRPSPLRVASRRIHASSNVPHKERFAATRFLFVRVLPLVWTTPPHRRSF